MKRFGSTLEVMLGHVTSTRWGLNEPRLFSVIGEELYLRFVETNFLDLDELKPSLERFVQQHGALGCACVTLPNLADIDMGDEGERNAMSTFEIKANRAAPYWWLSLYQCAKCQQWWLVAQEERINDVYLLKRLSDQDGTRIATTDVWPDDFDSFEVVIQLGRDRGHRCDFTDEHNRMLAQTAAELATARQDLSIADLVSLFGINEAHAERIANLAIGEHSAPNTIGRK